MTLRQPKRRASERRLHRGRRRCVARSGPAWLNAAVNTGIRSLHGKHQSKTRDGSHYFCTKQRSTSTDSRASEPRTQRVSGARGAPRDSNATSASTPTFANRFFAIAETSEARRRTGDELRDEDVRDSEIGSRVQIRRTTLDWPKLAATAGRCRAARARRHLLTSAANAERPCAANVREPNCAAARRSEPNWAEPRPSERIRRAKPKGRDRDFRIFRSISRESRCYSRSTRRHDRRDGSGWGRTCLRIHAHERSNVGTIRRYARETPRRRSSPFAVVY